MGEANGRCGLEGEDIGSGAADDENAVAPNGGPADVDIGDSERPAFGEVWVEGIEAALREPPVRVIDDAVAPDGDAWLVEIGLNRSRAIDFGAGLGIEPEDFAGGAIGVYGPLRANSQGSEGDEAEWDAPFFGERGTGVGICDKIVC
jgi:hypothetical protein